MVLGSSPVAVTSPSDFAPASSKEFLDIQATIECGFTLKRVRDMTRTYRLKLMFGNNKEIDYPKQNLHIFAENAENAPVSNNISIQIQSIYVIASNCGFSETELVTAQNRKLSDTGGLPKCLKLKLKSKVTLATNLDV